MRTLVTRCTGECLGKLRQRVGEVGWVIEHLDDLEADFLRFYRVDDIYALDGARFMRLAWRVSVYGGVMHMRLQEQERPHEAASPAPVQQRHSGAASSGGAKIIPLSQFMTQFPGTVEHVKEG